VRPIFKDTKVVISPQETFLGWGYIYIYIYIYRKFMEEDYLDVIPPSDLATINIDSFVFSNIRRSHLHIVVSRTPVMPYFEAI
jgi:hypothetical protein